jgi:outer membrane protein insertion porin family
MRHLSFFVVLSCLVLVLTCSAVWAQSRPEPRVNSERDANESSASYKPIRFIGLQSVSEQDLAKLLREEGAIPRGDDSSVGDAIRVLEEALQARGYMDSAVSAVNDGQSITFSIAECPRYRLREIRFEGNKGVSPPELATTTTKCLKPMDDGKGGHDISYLEYCLRKATDSLRTRGYLKATIGQQTFAKGLHELTVTVPVTEGVRYRVGKVQIEGAAEFSVDALRARLSLQEGHVADAEAIGRWLYEDVKGLYGDHGYIQYTAEVEPEFQPVKEGVAEGIVDFKITIEEGPRFKVRSIKLIGASSAEPYLRSLMPLREGDIYNQSRFRTSIDKLNETGLFDSIDRDANVDFTTNEEDGLLEISIYVVRPARVETSPRATLRARQSSP